MGTASSLFPSMINTVSSVFWHSITYAGRSISAGIKLDVIIETQNGITQAEAVFRLKKSDFTSSPPATGDSVTIPTGTIGAGSYRVGEVISENQSNYTVTGVKIG